MPPVTAERSPPDFADHRSRLAGDGRLVDRRDAFDDFAVGGNELSGGDDHRCRRCAASNWVPSRSAPSGRSRLAMVSERALRSVSAWALPRPSAMASAKLANSTVNHSHSVICRLKPKSPRPRDQQDRRDHAADLHHEHDRIALMCRGFSFTNESTIARRTIFHSQMAFLRGLIGELPTRTAVESCRTVGCIVLAITDSSRRSYRLPSAGAQESGPG